MSPVRRRSARLAGPGATPKPPSKAAMPQLSSLAEGDEATPESTTESAVEQEQQQDEPQQKRSAMARARATRKANPPPPAAQDLMKDLPPAPSHSMQTPLKPVPSTPVSSSPLKPPHSEMHPSKVQQTTQPLEPGLLLGFADIKTAAHAASTPSKICPPPPAREPNSTTNSAGIVAPSSPFTFCFSARPGEEAEPGGHDGPEAEDGDQDDGRHADLGLGEDALKIMQGLRGETAKIKEELVAQQEAADRAAAAALAAADGSRKIAKPKGRIGRFSAAHMAEFRKMDSIENHPSAFRAANSRFNSVTAASSTAANTTAMRRSPSKPNVGEPAAADAAVAAQQHKPSLKRTQSKANLGDDNSDPVAAAAISTFSHPPSLSAIRRAMFHGGEAAPVPASRSNGGEAAPVPPSSSLKRTISKTSLHSKEAAPASCLPQPTMSRTQSKPNLGTGDHAAAAASAISKSETPTSPSKISAPGRGGSAAAAAATPSVKRIKQRIGDDATTGRPTSSDGTSIPRLKPSGRDLDSRSPNRPRSNLARFRESMLGRAGARTAAPEPSLPRPVARTAAAEGSTSPKKVLSPNFAEARATIRARLSEVKKMRAAELAKDAAMFEARRQEKSSIPVPSAAQTPGPTRIDRAALPSAPVTTPRRTFLQRLHFTPRTTQAALSHLHNSPTPVKVGPIRIETRDISASPAIGTRPGADAAALKVPSITYPDLSKYKETSETPVKAEENKTESAAPPSVPGSFTFRADHTIEFDAGSRPAGFGPTRGQSSIRHVRDSIMSALRMPGSFPDSDPNKENRGPSQEASISADPALIDKTIEAAGIPHGIEHKKRARATWDDEESELEREQTSGPAKKHKSSHPSVGRDIFTTAPSKPAPGAHELAQSSSPVKNPTLAQTPNQPSASKKKPFLSVSRLNMLAQPKNRR